MQPKVATGCPLLSPQRPSRSSSAREQRSLAEVSRAAREGRACAGRKRPCGTAPPAPRSPWEDGSVCNSF